MVARGVLKALQRGGGDLLVATIDGLAGETLGEREFVQDYGLSSWPKPGAEVVAAFLAGLRSNGVVLRLFDRRYQIDLLEGEAAIHDDLGQRVHLTRTGIVADTPWTSPPRPAGNIASSARPTNSTPRYRPPGTWTAMAAASPAWAAAPTRTRPGRSVPWSRRCRCPSPRRRARAMADRLIAFDGARMTGDLVVAGNVIVTTDDLSTAVAISLFSDRRAGDDDVLPTRAPGGGEYGRQPPMDKIALTP
ncbi:MAG: phage baseplate assembly protein [Magnetospirillum sp.]|nr:phage baseplate assembly protein [Magnetospirillum sp.]